MRAHFLALVSGLSLVQLGACSAYDPTLGASPFLCGTSDPKCPDDYECKDNGAGVMACIIAGPTQGVDAAVDTNSFNCADDSVLEGGTRNDSIATSSSTPVAASRASITFAGLSICPDGDKDTYRVEITSNNQNLHAEITYDAPEAGGVALSLQIFGSSGVVPIAMGSPLGGNKVGVTIPNAPMSSSPYYVQVLGPTIGNNNYKLTLEVTGT